MKFAIEHDTQLPSHLESAWPIATVSHPTPIPWKVILLSILHNEKETLPKVVDWRIAYFTVTTTDYSFIGIIYYLALFQASRFHNFSHKRRKLIKIERRRTFLVILCWDGLHTCSRWSPSWVCSSRVRGNLLASTPSPLVTSPLLCWDFQGSSAH